MGKVTRKGWIASRPVVLAGADVHLNVALALAYKGSSGQYTCAIPLGDGDIEHLLRSLAHRIGPDKILNIITKEGAHGSGG